MIVTFDSLIWNFTIFVLEWSSTHIVRSVWSQLSIPALGTVAQNKVDRLKLATNKVAVYVAWSFYIGFHFLWNINSKVSLADILLFAKYHIKGQQNVRRFWNDAAQLPDSGIGAHCRNSSFEQLNSTIEQIFTLLGMCECVCVYARANARVWVWGRGCNFGRANS